jgi:hypothetical protein
MRVAHLGFVFRINPERPVARMAGSYDCMGHDFRRSPPCGRPVNWLAFKLMNIGFSMSRLIPTRFQTGTLSLSLWLLMLKKHLHLPAPEKTDTTSK